MTMTFEGGWKRTGHWHATAWAVVRGWSVMQVFPGNGIEAHRRALEFAYEFGGEIVPVEK